MFHQKRPLTLLQRIQQYIQQASQLPTSCHRAIPDHHIRFLHLRVFLWSSTQTADEIICLHRSRFSEQTVREAQLRTLSSLPGLDQTAVWCHNRLANINGVTHDGGVIIDEHKLQTTNTGVFYWWQYKCAAISGYDPRPFVLPFIIHANHVFIV